MFLWASSFNLMTLPETRTVQMRSMRQYCHLLNSGQKDEVSDTTDDDSSTEADKINCIYFRILQDTLKPKMT